MPNPPRGDGSSGRDVERPFAVPETAVVISVAVLASGGDPGGYYLARQAGCAADYYTGVGERAGAWLGAVAAAAGLVGQLDAAGQQTLRALLDGRAPDGRVLVAPVLRADPPRQAAGDAAGRRHPR